MNSMRNHTRVILQNNCPTPDSGWVRFRNNYGQLNDVPIGGAPVSSYGYHIPPWGTMELETDGIWPLPEIFLPETAADGAGPQLQTGPMEVVSDRGTDSQLKGTEIFELLGYSVSVANAPQYDYHRVYVSVTADENTGVGLYNPDLLNPIIMDLVLMDDEGDELAQADMTMDPGQQLARFVDEAELFQAYFNANPGECKGTLNITVRDGNSACIMGIIQKRATGAMIAVLPSYLRFGSKLTFPQYVNGETNGTLNRTRIILMNNGDVTETGNIRFRNNTGQLASVPIGGVPQNTVNFSIDPMGTLEIETDGTGTQLMTGPVEVTSDLGATSQLQGTEIFELLGYSVSMPDAPESSSHLVYVSVTSKENTGIAAFNPNLTSAVTMDLALIDDQGVEQAQAVMTLTAGQQLARFADEPELFQAFFNGVTGDWKGTLRITVRNQNTACVMGIIQKRATGAMIAVSTD